MSAADENRDRLVIQGMGGNGVVSNRDEVIVRLDEGSPTITLNETGWEVVERPQKPGLVRWTGVAPITQDVPIIIDGFLKKKIDGKPNSHKSVQKEVKTLRRLAGLAWTGYDRHAPMPVTVRGPIHHDNLRWVISGIAEGESIRANNGVLIRYHAVITLTQYRNPDQIRVKRRPRPTSHKVKKGETLKKISVRLFGTPKWWKRIGNAQKKPIKDPDKELKAGRVLRIPRIPPKNPHKHNRLASTGKRWSTKR